MPRPTPLAPPVMNATLPSTSSIRPQRHASTETVGPGMLRNFARIGEPMKMLKWPFVWPPATTTLIRFGLEDRDQLVGGAFR